MAAKWTSEQNATGRVWFSFLFAAKLSDSDPTAPSNELPHRELPMKLPVNL